MPTALGPAPTLPDLSVESASGSEVDLALAPVRRRPRYHRSSSHGLQSSGTATPLAAPVPSPTPLLNVGLPPGAVDYFHNVTAERHSWRAMVNLALVAGGRCTVSLGLAGVSEGFVPGGLAARPRLPLCGPHGPEHEATDFHPAIFGLGCAGAVVGLIVHTYGVARFYSDTAKLNRSRANLVATAGTLGAFLVAGGGTFYAWALVANRPAALWEALPVRAVGNALVYACIPNSFAASEMVHGDVPIKHRLIARDTAFALGGMMLMVWAQISSPCPSTPLYARELAQVLGIAGIAVGAALPRSDSNRAQAGRREALRQIELLSPQPI